MEIISYVGDRQKIHKNIPAFLNRRFHYWLNKNRQRSSVTGIYGLSFTQPAKVRKLYRPAVSLQEVVRSVENIYKKAVHDIWLLLFSGICVATPFLVHALCSYADNFARPLVLESLPSQELEILNKAMSEFALNQDDQLDKDGNVLNDDGTVLKPSDVSFQQPVTYRKYTIISGDTLLGITRKSGLTNISTLISVNDIDNVRQLRAGQRLRIPSLDGLIYTVRRGDTLTGLSVRYHVSVEDLLDCNDLSSHVVAVGAQLFIPGAKLSSDSIRHAMGELFMYPLSVSWRLTSNFGPRPDPFTGVSSFHTGIDMAVPPGTPIRAAMSGTVIAVGYTNIFGNYVIINHGNGYQTLYAHMSKVLAHTGQELSQGTRIGLVGSTGYSTGPHLHFTVYKNGKLIDPLSVLK
jgi:murein DD-endopeptidase MepM/ murein hydrolase activator NlpD